MKERFRIRSIPPRTTLDALREQKSSSVSIGRLPPREPRQSRLEQGSGGFNVKDHVFQKPTQERPSRSLVSSEIERITWQVEIIEDCNSAGDLVLIAQFRGIGFGSTPVFEKSRVDYGADSSVFYSRIMYKNGSAFLILATFGDIFESQVVATKIDVRPFFREETRLPQLTITHDPTSMAVYEKNHLVVVGYNRL